MYARVNQPNANNSQPANLVRSDSAPLISATVMMANIIWKTMNTYVGMPVLAPATSHSSPIQLVPEPKYWLKLPRKLFRPELPLVPNARVNP